MSGYDYVALSWLFGGINADTGGDWPSTWPYYFHDIATYEQENNLQGYQKPTIQGVAHHALNDARQIALAHASLLVRKAELEEVIY
jgi:hypothetical protein